MLRRTEVDYDPFRDGELVASAPTTEEQKEILTTIAIEPSASLCYNEVLLLTLKGELKVSALESALNGLLLRHDSLRSSFSPDGKFFMAAAPQSRKLPIWDFSKSSEVEKEARLNAKKQEAVAKPFDLRVGPLFRFELFKLEERRHILLLAAHHVVCDGWSISILARELSLLYEAEVSGKEARLPKGKPFYECAAQTESDESVEAFWKQELAGVPAHLDLPFDFEPPKTREFSSRRLERKLSQGVYSNVKHIAGKSKASSYHFLMAAFNALLRQWCGKTDIVVGASMAGQTREDLANTVGHLVNMLPMRIKLREEQTFAELLQAVKSKALALSERQNITFGKLAQSLNVARNSARIPLINVVFNVDQQYPGQGMEFKRLEAEYESVARVAENFEIFLNAVICGDSCVLECQYNTQLFAAQTIERLLEAYEQALIYFSQSPNAAVTSFSCPLLLNSNGEDRSKSAAAPAVKESEAKPVAGNMALARQIWEEALGIADVPADADFFAIGGHSLIAVDICQRAQELAGVNLRFRDLSLHPTIEKFATLLPEEKRENSLGGSPKGLASGLDRAELTLSQFQAWYQEQLHPGTSLHHLPSAIRVKRPVDASVLGQTYLKIMENHPALRTSIEKRASDDATLAQTVHGAQEAYQRLGFEMIEVGSLEEAVAQMRNLALAPFDLGQAPLFRAKLFKLDAQDYILFNCFHHIIFDGWSFDVFFQALSDAYEGISLAPEGSSFLDYAKWQQVYLQSEEFKQDLAYWSDKLKAPLPVLDLPTDYPRPAQSNPESATFAFELAGELELKVRQFCAAKSVSLFNVFLSCFQRTLMDYSGQSEVVVGIPLRGRNSLDQKNTIGYFVNGVAIRSSKMDSIDEFLRQAQNDVDEALSRQNAPFEKVKEALGLKRDPSRPPVAQTFFSFQEVGNRKNMFAGAEYVQINLEKGAIHTDLDMWIKAGKKGVEGAIEYRKDLFAVESVKHLFNYFVDLIDFVVSERSGQFGDFQSASATKELEKVNDTFVPRTRRESVADYVDRMARREPGKAAVVRGEERLSYGELARQSAKFAGALVAAGVGRGDLVGLCFDRSTSMMVALLGVMKAGAGYTPLDPGFPQARLDYMLEQSQTKFLAANEKYLSRFANKGLKAMAYETMDWESAQPVKIEVEPDQSAYVIYTSGSTGRPKGVNISYRSKMNFLHAAKNRPGFGSDDKVLAITTLSFDISVLELFLPLLAGSTVYLAKREEIIDGEALKSAIELHGINVLQATPPTLRILLGAGWRGGRNFKILCGGEAFPRDLAAKLIPMGTSVYNMYGPTEAAVWATCKKLDDPEGPILVGRPLENYTVYVLDDQARPLPFGAVGELYIGGDGVALGYYHREDLTRERFVDNPFGTKGKLYKTGDLARFRHNGELECLGRNDDQVKIRGYRIELGEVEAALGRMPEVEQCVVMAREDRPGDIRLVAYLKLRAPGTLKPFEFRKALGQQLPTYMVPVNYVEVEEFALTLTGKVDKKALPAPALAPIVSNGASAKREERAAAAAPSEGLESKLAAIWTQVIGVEDYRPEDDYFEVGGNSLLSVELFARIASELGVDLPLSTLVSRSKFKDLLDAAQAAKGIDGAYKSEPGAARSCSIPSVCSSVVEIKNSGKKNPVFCFHGVGGNILNYLRIAPAFGEHPLLGVQSQGVDGRSAPLKRVEDMAQRYMEEIRLVQPQGPYILAGGSMGGLLAFETARKLRQAGEEVRTVIMLDTFGPGSNFKGYGEKKNALANMWFSLRWRVKKSLVRAQCSLLEMIGLSIPHRLRHFNIEACNYEAIWSHQWGTYEGDIDLIRAPIADNGWYGRPDMGWKEVASGNVNIHIVEGQHENFVEAPGLAEALQRVLAKY